MKQASVSSTVHGGGKRRGTGAARPESAPQSAAGSASCRHLETHRRLLKRIQGRAEARTDCGARVSRTAIADTASSLHLHHRHVLRSHHHRDVTGEFVGRKRIGGVSLGGSASRADDVVLERRTVDHEICGGAFREGVVRAQNRNWYLPAAPSAWDANDRNFVDGPALNMWQFEASCNFIGTASQRKRVGM